MVLSLTNLTAMQLQNLLRSLLIKKVSQRTALLFPNGSLRIDPMRARGYTALGSH